MRLKTELEKRTCEVCGNEFIPKRLTSIFCSHKCSVAAVRKKNKETEDLKKLQQMVDEIPNDKEYLSVPEVALMYSVSKVTLYKLIRQGEIPAINIGKRLTRVRKSDAEALFAKRVFEKSKEKPQLKKLYSLEPEDCYTIGEIREKFNVSDQTVYKQIRQNSIPTRQIGKFVYAPKEDIDNIFK